VDVAKLILELRHELQQIDEAIRSLERMATGNRLKPIAPPKRLSAVEPRKNRQKARTKPAPPRTANALSTVL
jgi:hypothetical protein